MGQKPLKTSDKWRGFTISGLYIFVDISSTLKGMQKQMLEPNSSLNSTFNDIQHA